MGTAAVIFCIISLIGGLLYRSSGRIIIEEKDKKPLRNNRTTSNSYTQTNWEKADKQKKMMK